MVDFPDPVAPPPAPDLAFPSRCRASVAGRPSELKAGMSPLDESDDNGDAVPLPEEIDPKLPRSLRPKERFISALELRDLLRTQELIAHALDHEGSMT